MKANLTEEKFELTFECPNCFDEIAVDFADEDADAWVEHGCGFSCDVISIAEAYALALTGCYGTPEHYEQLSWFARNARNFAQFADELDGAWQRVLYELFCDELLEEG
jgi:hypothetical protein